MPRFVNVAHPTDKQPNLLNVEDIVRIRAGSANNNRTGRDEQCTIFLRTIEDTQYADNTAYREMSTLEVFLPVREIVRRMIHELLVI